MRLLIATPSHYLQGGVERIIESLARNLPPHGIEVLVALAKGARFHDPDRFRAAFPDVRAVEVDGTSGTTYGRRRALRGVIERVEPDVVLIARMFDAYPVCAELKLRGKAPRLAVTVQAWERDYFLDLERYADFVDLCVTSGELIATEARKFVPHVISIPGGVAPPRHGSEAEGRLQKAEGRRQKAEGRIDHPIRVGYVGRLEQVQKRALDLVAFEQKLTIPHTLDIAGDGTVAAELRARLPHARFHGWVSTDALYERIYPELDVLVHFAEFEGLTIAPREAMAHGVVPVVSRFKGAEDFIDGETALTFEVGDVDAAVAAVERLYRDRELFERLSHNARASQSGIRSELGAAAAWANAFKDCVARPPRIGATLPPVPRDQGLLTRLHVPPAIAEVVRRVRRREHADPGSEWPHWSGIGDNRGE